MKNAKMKVLPTSLIHVTFVWRTLFGNNISLCFQFLIEFNAILPYCVTFRTLFWAVTGSRMAWLQFLFCRLKRVVEAKNRPQIATGRLNVFDGVSRGIVWEEVHVLCSLYWIICATDATSWDSYWLPECSTIFKRSEECYTFSSRSSNLFLRPPVKLLSCSFISFVCINTP